MIRLSLIAILAAGPVGAETVFAARTIPARSIITLSDMFVDPAVLPGAVTDPAAIVGLEARVALYAGRPIRPGDVGPPAIVERNAIVPLIYDTGGLVIETEGRALDRAGIGETIRVMNVASRTTVTATIGVNGAAYVSN